ncbi:LytTR family transcriptional regulator DNA-binding domain-containing protein [Aequorivita sp. SDUM287046]|uniref:LytTR family transcriptional regulator DNA-binding domain-containing protein n=1 Tax=Aequorivita aurantiaca TaxID=3053356 RepID=A0ABT8DKN0_9FLAO|nr:LytTR family transcriptional regulator DNA-binding domain-containing protein [Aequorivita aurantiaca]MDN3725394.1 LytTR family transcriptional regulator DNA-binding domain-containing protein [Aequorivita aurantiaca]
MIRVLSISNNAKLHETIQETCKVVAGFHYIGGAESIHFDESVLNIVDVEIIILDLDIARLNNNNVAIIKRLFKNVQLIGITGAFEKAYFGLKGGCVDVCLRPLDSDAIVEALIKCQNKMINPDRLISIGSSKEAHYLKVSEILFIKADDNDVDFHLCDGTVIPFFNSLKHFESRLSIPFIRVQKSYIINAAMVFRINHVKRYLMFRNSHSRIPFSPKYLENISRVEGVIKNYHF